MHLHFLGTGAGSPATQRNVSATALNLCAEGAGVWLFDCGEATQHQILHTSIRPGKIRHIFITHLHGDHIFGLPGLLGSRSFLSGNQAEPLYLYGPQGLRRFVETALDVSQTYLSYPLHIHELDGDSGSLQLESGFTVRYRLLDHRIRCYGFRIIEAERAGSLQTEKLRALGIGNGPILGQLKRGESVSLPDGRVLHGRDFLAPPQRGREVVIFGDTRYRAEHADFCRDADVLVHEATFADSDRAAAHEHGHATAAQAATLARDAHVGVLYLNHISAKYSGDAVAVLENEARAVFANSHIVHDFQQADIPLKKAFQAA